MIEFLLSAAIGYGLGSIPFGLVLSQLAGLGDIRKVGSGNIGATNVLRTGRKDVALATLLLDGGKGAIAVLLALLTGLRPEIAGAAAMIGHCYPIWLGFRGGKGVATFLGTILMLHFPAGLLTCATWLFSALFTRISSLSALIATAAAPLIFFAMSKPAYSIASIVMIIVVYVRHKDNIKRIIDGTEPKIGKKSTQDVPPSPKETNQPADL